MAVRLACRVCEHVRTTEVLAVAKEDASPVTTADYAAQVLVNRTLRSVFPKDAMVSEEHSKELVGGGAQHDAMRKKILAVLQHVDHSFTEAQMLADLDYGKMAEGALPTRFWTLDPVDGTKGFLRNDQYAVALGLVEHGQVVLGVLGCPQLPANLKDKDSVRGSIFVASRGEGCSMLAIEDESAEPVKMHVAETSDASQAVLLESFESGHTAHDVSSHVARALGVVQASVRMDSQAKYAALARGDGSIYLRLPRPGKRYDETIWDHAAGMLVVAEAGGVVTDVFGAPLDFSKGAKLYANTGVIATNGKIHGAVVKAVQDALKAAGAV